MRVAAPTCMRTPRLPSLNEGQTAASGCGRGGSTPIEGLRGASHETTTTLLCLWPSIPSSLRREAYFKGVLQLCYDVTFDEKSSYFMACSSKCFNSQRQLITFSTRSSGK